MLGSRPASQQSPPAGRAPAPTPTARQPTAAAGGPPPAGTPGCAPSWRPCRSWPEDTAIPAGGTADQDPDIQPAPLGLARRTGRPPRSVPQRARPAARCSGHARRRRARACAGSVGPMYSTLLALSSTCAAVSGKGAGWIASGQWPRREAAGPRSKARPAPSPCPGSARACCCVPGGVRCTTPSISTQVEVSMSWRRPPGAASPTPRSTVTCAGGRQQQQQWRRRQQQPQQQRRRKRRRWRQPLKRDCCGTCSSGDGSSAPTRPQACGVSGHARRQGGAPPGWGSPRRPHPRACKLSRQEPSLTSRKAKEPLPALRPVRTHPPMRSVAPTCAARGWRHRSQGGRVGGRPRGADWQACRAVQAGGRHTARLPHGAGREPHPRRRAAAALCRPQHRCDGGSAVASRVWRQRCH